MSSTRRDRRTLRGAIVLLLLVVLAGLPVQPHNVAVTHPEITDVALRLMRTEDMAAHGASGPPTNACPECAFSELWANAGVRNPGSDCNDNGNYWSDFDANVSTVMVGAVAEDGSSIYSVYNSEYRTTNHFYHAITGVGLENSHDSSRIRAQELFRFALDVFDYSDQSQQRSYLYLGRFLHHIEDMSSPAHVHNDPHVYYDPLGFDSDKDDYEARWLPCVVGPGVALRNLIDRPGSVSRTVTSANDIWPAVPQTHTIGYAPPETSLAGYVFNRTTYWANLVYPTDGTPPDPLTGDTGELSEMFPGDPADPADNGLAWHDPIIGFDHWDISPMSGDGVGEYFYKQTIGSADDWWPDTAANTVFPADAEPDGVMAQYYLEQLMSGETTGELVPERMRDDWTIPWDASTNPVTQNTKCSGGTNPGANCSKPADCTGGGTCAGTAIVTQQQNHLLVPAVEYVAGAAKWWFRYANLPPYLKQVEVTQAAAVKYSAEWQDPMPAVMEDHVLVEAGSAVMNTTEAIQIVDKRTFNHNPLDRKHLNALADVTLVLEFNEPIRTLSEFKLLDGAGAEVRDLAAVAGMPAMSMDRTSWTYTIPMAAFTGLNGEYTIKVMAQDMHEHLDDGGELDATPATPAKRNVAVIDLTANPVNIPWHTAATDLRFAYDFTTGDRNHRLLIDSVKPETTITVTP